MLSGAIETYAAALIAIASATAIGGGVLAAAGRREWSWTAPAVGLAAATVIAWWAVRLPGHGVTALICLVLATVAGAALSARLFPALGASLARGWPVLAGALVLGAVPFVVEGHFGVLGTGFNVDMSQHLFAADWLADPRGPAPGLYEQGYPLGPHALAVAAAELTGEPATAFSGVTIAAPALLALTSLAACAGLGRARASAIALLAGFAYLVATYLAQGSFKELFEAVLLVGFALLLAETARAGGSWRAGVPFGVLAAGALYAYSGPGLAWLAATALAWGALELLRRRDEASARVGAALPAVGTAVVVALVLAAPEADRILDFGGSVGTVSERAAAPGGSDAGAPTGGARVKGPEFDDDLGNLFGQISPLEAFGVWPSGDFRVAPGDGAVPAFVFYLGALLGAVCLALGVAGAWRRAETALLAALAAAAAIWLGARAFSTPYTTAKALMMVAPVAMLISARGLLDPGFLTRAREPAARGRAGLALVFAFAAAAAASGMLALANAPVGPREYTPGVFELSDRFAGRSVLLLVPDEVLAEERGEEFYGWELREAGSFSIEPASGETDTSGFDLVLRLGAGGEVEVEGG